MPLLGEARLFGFAPVGEIGDAMKDVAAAQFAFVREIAVARDAISLLEAIDIGAGERAVDLALGPDIEFALFAFAVGVEA